MSLNHLSRNKHHLKNKSTIIKISNNGYPNDVKVESLHRLTFSYGNRKNLYIDLLFLMEIEKMINIFYKKKIQFILLIILSINQIF